MSSIVEHMPESRRLQPGDPGSGGTATQVRGVAIPQLEPKNSATHWAQKSSGGSQGRRHNQSVDFSFFESGSDEQ